MKRSSTFPLVEFALLAAVILAGCASGAKPLTGADKDAVLAYSEPQTENLFQGYNQKDYAAFSKNFDAAMSKALNEASFTNLENTLMPKIGKYVSRSVSSVATDGKYIQVVYTAKFEQEDGVTVRLVFTPDDPHNITGLWFDSPKLREK